MKFFHLKHHLLDMALFHLYLFLLVPSSDIHHRVRYTRTRVRSESDRKTLVDKHNVRGRSEDLNGGLIP